MNRGEHFKLLHQAEFVCWVSLLTELSGMTARVSQMKAVRTARQYYSPNGQTLRPVEKNRNRAVT